MASYLVKAKGLDLSNLNSKKITIGKFYSGDRFYTLLNEYIDKNLSRKNWLLGFIIKVLFRSSNYKHDPQIANGKKWSVFLFDFICCAMFIAFCCLISSIIIAGIVDLAEKLEAMYKKDPSEWGPINAVQMFFATIFSNWQRLLTMGIGVILTGAIGLSWIFIILKIRKKNKPLSLQAYVEKKISICLSFRFLIKLSNKIKTNSDVIVLENFEAQGAAAPRWTNVQMINLISSIFNDFTFVFKFDELSDEDFKDLSDIMKYDFKMVELVNSDNVKWEVYDDTNWKGNPFKRNTKEIDTKTSNKPEKTQELEVQINPEELNKTQNN